MEEEQSIPPKPSVYLEREEGNANFKIGFYDERNEESEVHHLLREVHPLQRAASPVLSYVSLKSDRSMAEPPKFSDKAENFQPR